MSLVQQEIQKAELKLQQELHEAQLERQELKNRLRRLLVCWFIFLCLVVVLLSLYFSQQRRQEEQQRVKNPIPMFAVTVLRLNEKTTTFVIQNEIRKLPTDKFLLMMEMEQAAEIADLYKERKTVDLTLLCLDDYRATYTLDRKVKETCSREFLEEYGGQPVRLSNGTIVWLLEWKR